MVDEAKEPAFCEPWQAQAFALANSLIDQGVFTADEWAQTLGDEIKRAQAAGDPDTGETYYNHWLAALVGSTQVPPTLFESAASLRRAR